MSIKNNKGRRRRIRRMLVAYYGPRCMRCKREKQNGGLTLDHVVPLCEGGADDESNLQLLCMKCHRKVDQTPKRGTRPEKQDYRPWPWPLPVTGLGDCPEKRAAMLHPLPRENP